MESYNRSVWYGQVDSALIAFIPTIVKTLNRDGDAVPVPVLLRMPENEFAVEVFPSVSIEYYDERVDPIRYYPHDVVVDTVFDEDGTGVAVIEKSAIPYNLYYQIDFWAEYREDINEMTRRWSAYTPRHSVLEVTDSSGVKRHCVMTLKGDNKVTVFSEGNTRTFRKTYSYEIKVELDEGVSTTKPIVTNREIKY